MPSELEALLGQWQWYLLLKRDIFSALDKVYGWVREHREETAGRSVPKAVLQELRSLLGLAMFIEADLGAAWHPEVLMVDAGPTGYGVVTSTWPSSSVRALGRRGLCGFAGCTEPPPEWAVNGYPWKLALRGEWKAPDHQNVREMRAGTLGVLHWSRRRDFRQRKAL